MYAQDSAKLPTFAAEKNHEIIGFISLLKHFPQSWEVHCIAVSAQARGTGVGTVLLSHAEQWLTAQKVKFLQIKTIAETKADANYAESRAFYQARGYAPMEVFPSIWSPSNPALQLVKSLRDA